MTGACRGQRSYQLPLGSTVTNDLDSPCECGELNSRLCKNSKSSQLLSCLSSTFSLFLRMSYVYKMKYDHDYPPFSSPAPYISLTIPPSTSYLLLFLFIYRLLNPVSAICRGVRTGAWKPTSAKPLKQSDAPSPTSIHCEYLLNRGGA